MRRSALQRDTAEKETCRAAGVPPFEQIALLLQGGGALGAYQAGVYEALAEADLHPDWVAGISIGAINSAIIAGNPPSVALTRCANFGTQSPLRHLANPIFSMSSMTTPSASCSIRCAPWASSCSARRISLCRACRRRPFGHRAALTKRAITTWRLLECSLRMAAGAGSSPVTGKIAMTASPIYFRTSPPLPMTPGTTRSKKALRS